MTIVDSVRKFVSAGTGLSARRVIRGQDWDRAPRDAGGYVAVVITSITSDGAPSIIRKLAADGASASLFSRVPLLVSCAIHFVRTASPMVDAVRLQSWVQLPEAIRAADEVGLSVVGNVEVVDMAAVEGPDFQGRARLDLTVA
ncbi:MAG: hypothetical protein OXQ29_17085, partial [Rhodospirillaceae bacterium]|nr:hypothetical protein [Rhodospirillaceae bacterium]